MALHLAQPREQHVEHATDIIDCVYAPAIDELVGSVLLVGSVHTAERNAVRESAELLGDH